MHTWKTLFQKGAAEPYGAPGPRGGVLKYPSTRRALVDDINPALPIIRNILGPLR